MSEANMRERMRGWREEAYLGVRGAAEIVKYWFGWFESVPPNTPYPLPTNSWPRID